MSSLPHHVSRTPKPTKLQVSEVKLTLPGAALAHSARQQIKRLVPGSGDPEAALTSAMKWSKSVRDWKGHVTARNL